MQQVDPPEVPRENEIVALTSEELERLIKAFEGTPHYVPVALGARTGLRRDEIVALSVSDVDVEARVVRVRRILEDVAPGADGPSYTEPKSPDARNPIPLDDTAIKLVREHIASLEADLAKSGSGAGDRLLFARADGSSYGLGEFETAFHDVAAQAGFPGLRFHHLRDTLAAHLVQAGEPIGVVAGRMRHQDQSSTSRRYFQ